MYIYIYIYLLHDKVDELVKAAIDPRVAQRESQDVHNQRRHCSRPHGFSICYTYMYVYVYC